MNHHKDAQKQWRDILYPTIGLFIAAMVLWGAVVIGSYRYHALTTRGRTATATLMAKESRSVLVYRFVPEGRTEDVRITERNDNEALWTLQVGDTFPVLYLPDDPAVHRTEPPSIAEVVLGSIIALLCSLCAWFGVLMLRRMRSTFIPPGDDDIFVWDGR